MNRKVIVTVGGWPKNEKQRGRRRVISKKTKKTARVRGLGLVKGKEVWGGGGEKLFSYEWVGGSPPLMSLGVFGGFV